jgi:predicted P-loop ATPase/GTPase
MVAHQVTNRQHHMVAVVMEPVLVLLVSVEVKHMTLHHHHSVHKRLYKNMQLILKVSSLIQIHKSFVDQLLAEYKPTHKISKFASFNHHLSHHQA